MTIRVQLSRKTGWKMPPNTVTVARPGKFGNPFHLDSYEDRETCVRVFRSWLAGDMPNLLPEARFRVLRNLESLRGKNLACWCPPGSPCHADVLLELANAKEPRT